MAVTISKSPSTPVLHGSEYHRRTEVTLDSSLAEGGEPLTHKQLGFRRVTRAICQVKNGSESESTTLANVRYDESGEKLIPNDQKTQKPMAKEANLGKVVVIVDAWGVPR